jgi:hypothetical protein
VPKLNHAFLMAVPAHEAKERFLAELGPELEREGDFRLERDEPRSLLYSDSLAPPLGPASFGGTGAAANVDLTSHFELEKLFAHHIRVEFVQVGAGTSVSLSGRAMRDVCASIRKLGGPEVGDAR